MLFGSVQMMSAGLEDTIVGGLEDRQSWDAQVYINQEGEDKVIERANQRGSSNEQLIEMPLGVV